MHDQVCAGYGGMNRCNAVHGQNITRGRTCEFISTMAGANGNRQGINTGLGYKVFGLLRVRQHLIVAEFALSANAIFFARLAGLQ